MTILPVDSRHALYDIHAVLMSYHALYHTIELSCMLYIMADLAFSGFNKCLESGSGSGSGPWTQNPDSKVDPIHDTGLNIKAKWNDILTLRNIAKCHLLIKTKNE